MERCPACNARLKDALTCPRCQTELGTVIGTERAAQQWLVTAIQQWQAGNLETSSSALLRSLFLKKTTLALQFRDFIIQQHYLALVELLAQKQLLPAQQLFYRLRLLLPHSQRLQQLRAFTDYLVAHPNRHSASLP